MQQHTSAQLQPHLETGAARAQRTQIDELAGGHLGPFDLRRGGAHTRLLSIFRSRTRQP